MGILNENDRVAVSSILKASSVHISTIVRLYKSEGTRWIEQFTGAAAIVTDHDQSRHIKIVDIMNSEVLFTQELYDNFDYQAPKPWFHTFECEDYVVGLSFADESDAQSFITHVHQLKKIVPQVTTIPSSAPIASIKKKKSFMDKFRGQKQEITISEPTNFIHTSSVSWNKNNEFEMRNIPMEWKQLLNGAGVKVSDLKNQRTSSMLMNVMIQHGSDLFEERPPVPERLGNGRIPPPPPTEVPSMESNNSGVSQDIPSEEPREEQPKSLQPTFLDFILNHKLKPVGPQTNRGGGGESTFEKIMKEKMDEIREFLKDEEEEEEEDPDWFNN